jgi:hypothetical protein
VKPAGAVGAGDAGETGGGLDDRLDDGVKDGLRPPAKPGEPDEPVDEAGSAGATGLGAPLEPFAPDEGDRRSPAPGPAAAAAPAAPSPDWLEADASVFSERANQLFVAAIACRTAWRPVSSTPLPDPPVSPRRSSSGFSLTFSAAEPALAAARKPAPGVFGLFGLPIPSAGNGGAGDEGAGDEGAGASVTPSSGAGSAPFWVAAVLAADREVPDADDADRDVPDRARDEDMVPLSSIVSAVSAPGSTSWPDGATITDGSVARPASSTPSSSVPNGAPFVPSAEIT